MTDLAITLRPVIDADLPVFFEHERDPESVRMAAFTADDPSDRAAFEAHWAKIRAMDTVTIRTIERAGDIAGHVASFTRGEELEVTFWLGRAFWGAGVATEALRQFLDIVIDRPIYARAAKDNAGSIRVLEKCGFEHVRDERGFANARGEEIDEVVMRFS
jgi:RimJ/RimL family protein N-acetyltransferase